MPVAVLLVGITGSGKTTVAQALADHGYTRLSVDEEVHRLHGRYGVDYPEQTYFERQRPVVEAIRARLVNELGAGNDVILDHGLWRRTERDAWQRTAREAGGHPVLVYLPAERDELLRRLTERNRREDANALTVSPEALDDFFDRFDTPADVEEATVYTGDLDALMVTLSAARHRQG
ncbi:AAA family ATPase [Streptomyces pakalii]|uniref:ATP-binding protein n=1 Tax=Streptomyces pakalii TaxID=3036494 RepID=A0ABT7D5U9_9ACTN|nr:ATP-binding protein [Streptomyces pakalii]MDJ1641176.1 ATP-binding protein [Streptomyces pakalii]